MGKVEVSRVTDPIEIVAGFSADRYSYFAVGRDRSTSPDAAPVFSTGMESMEHCTVAELAAELSPWVDLSTSQMDMLEADRKVELYRADREYREEQALAREQPAVERD